MSFEELYGKLNPEQKQAVEYGRGASDGYCWTGDGEDNGTHTSHRQYFKANGYARRRVFLRLHTPMPV